MFYNLINSIRLIGLIKEFDNNCVLAETKTGCDQTVLIRHIVEIHYNTVGTIKLILLISSIITYISYCFYY